MAKGKNIIKRTLRNWRKVERTEFGIVRKNGMRGGGRVPKKIKHPRLRRQKSQKHPIICVSLSLRPKEYPLEPLEGKKLRSRQCRQWCAKKRNREEIRALKKRIEVEKVDLKNRRHQIVRSDKEKVKDSYGFLLDERRSEK